MIANWIHIIIVHFAVIGTSWLAYRIIIHRKIPLDTKPWKGNFSGAIILAIITGVAYFTGPQTADWTKQVLASYSQDQVEVHALWGRIGFVIQGITGLIGIMGWASILQDEKPDRRISIILIVLLIINTLVIAYTAHQGGMVRRMDFIQ
jgi:Ca2+/Na+ antiporter